jgi:hypothetical protein
MLIATFCEIRAGDVVWFPPGRQHWHGATPTTVMMHIAVEGALDAKNVVGMEQVIPSNVRCSLSSAPLRMPKR